jgi:hypothetical protein
MIDESVSYFCLLTKSNTSLLIHNQLQLIRFSLLLKLDSVQGFDFTSIINSVKIRIDYYPIYESYRFYRASVC